MVRYQRKTGLLQSGFSAGLCPASPFIEEVFQAGASHPPEKPPQSLILLAKVVGALRWNGAAVPSERANHFCQQDQSLGWGLAPEKTTFIWPGIARLVFLVYPSF